MAPQPPPNQPPGSVEPAAGRPWLGGLDRHGHGRVGPGDPFGLGIRLAFEMQQRTALDLCVPKVDITDPLKPHRDLLPKYSDKEIHDITAYLVTLK